MLYSLRKDVLGQFIIILIYETNGIWDFVWKNFQEETLWKLARRLYDMPKMDLWLRSENEN